MPPSILPMIKEKCTHPCRHLQHFCPRCLLFLPGPQEFLLPEQSYLQEFHLHLDQMWLLPGSFLPCLPDPSEFPLLLSSSWSRPYLNFGNI